MTVLPPVADSVDAQDPVLRLIGVTQQYGTGATAVSALSGVDFEVRPGPSACRPASSARPPRAP